MELGPNEGPPQRGALWRVLRRRFGLEPNLLVILAAVVIVGMGQEMWIRYVPEYLVFLGGATWVVAAYGTVRDVLDGVYQYPGGWLADRLGRRAALIVFTLLAAAGYALCMLPAWQWVLVAAVFVMAWDSLTFPALFAIVGDNLPKQRRAVGFAVQSVLRRVPTILAPPLGGLLIVELGMSGGMQAALAVSIGLCFVAVVVIRLSYREPAPPRADALDWREVWRGMDGRLKRLLAADATIRWAEGIPRVFVVIYVIGVVGLSPLDFAWLVAIQRVTNVVLYLTLAPLSDRMNRKPWVLATFAFFALFPLALSLADGFAGAALAFFVAGMWEVGEPARKAQIVDLAHESARARTVGVYYLIRNLSVCPAAAVGGLLWDAVGPREMLWVASGVGVCGVLVYAVWGTGDEPGTAAAT